MKFAPILSLMVTIFALQSFAKGTSSEVCFQSQNGVVGKVQLNDKAATLRWDMDDFTESSKETGVVKNYQHKGSEVTAEILVGNISDVGALVFTFNPSQVIFQETNERGELLSKVDVQKRVTCPQETSPDELAN